jgi:hypothetical protein
MLSQSISSDSEDLRLHLAQAGSSGGEGGLEPGPPLPGAGPAGAGAAAPAAALPPLARGLRSGRLLTTRQAGLAGGISSFSTASSAGGSSFSSG